MGLGSRRAFGITSSVHRVLALRHLRKDVGGNVSSRWLVRRQVTFVAVCVVYTETCRFYIRFEDMPPTHVGWNGDTRA